MMSESMSDVGRYMDLMAFRSQASRTKWKKDTDVLGALMELRVLCKLDCTLVVDKD